MRTAACLWMHWTVASLSTRFLQIYSAKTKHINMLMLLPNSLRVVKPQTINKSYHNKKIIKIYITLNITVLWTHTIYTYIVFQTDLPVYYKPWMDIARNVPELISSHSLRLRIHGVCALIMKAFYLKRNKQHIIILHFHSEYNHSSMFCAK